MSTQITKLGLLSVLSTAVYAIPHGGGYGASGYKHSHHASVAYPSGGYPSGGFSHGGPWGGNSTVIHPTATGASTAMAEGYTGTSTITDTLFSTHTVVETIYMSAVPAGETAVAAAASSGGMCGPATITVTASEAVTITVTPGYAPAVSSVAAVVSVASSSAVYASQEQATPAYSAPAYSAPVYSAPAASSPASSKAVVPSSVEVPAASSYVVPATSVVVPATTAAPVPSSVYSAPVSSAAAPSSSAVTGNFAPPAPGGKRGIAYTPDNAKNGAAWTNLFPDAKDHWCYNWEHNTKGSVNCKYIPTLKSPSFFVDSWTSDIAGFKASGATHAFSFNECDNAGQANMGVADAVTQHASYFGPLIADGWTVGAPSVTSSTEAGKGLDWLKSFIASCTGDCKYDFLNVHWYGELSQAEDFKTFCKEAHALAPNMPLWITEVQATAAGGVPAAAGDQEAFLGEILSWVESQEYIVAISYYMVDNAEGMMVTGDALNAIGKAYSW